jgi:hypothetical protein
MERRELIKSIALLTGVAVVGGEFFLTGCKSAAGPVSAFTPATIALLDEVAETIIPTTDTPGAKVAQTGAFMKIMIEDCYTKEEQDTFIKGITTLNERCKKEYNQPFVDLEATQKLTLLQKLEREAKEYNTKREENKEKKAPPHYYSMMKQLTLWGFFSSETGMTQTLRHIPVPGRFDGNAPYTKGEKAWAE